MNRGKRPAVARFWQFSIFAPKGKTLSPQQHVDESKISLIDQRNTQFRVMSYIYMFDKVLTNGTSRLPQDKLVTGEKPVWIRKLTDLKNASSTVMILDAVISSVDTFPDKNFTEVVGGSMGSYDLFDSTNHLTKRTFPASSPSYFIPEGGNIGYGDGHVDWKSFEKMQHRLTLGQWFWW